MTTKNTNQLQEALNAFDDRYERRPVAELPVPIHDVNMVQLRHALMSANTLSAEQMIYAISMALIDARFACAIDAIIEAKEPGALHNFVVAACAHTIGQDPKSSPMTIRDAVRRMNAYALKHVERLIEPAAIETKVTAWLDSTLRTFVLRVVGLKDDYGRLEIADHENIIAKTIAERCRAAVERVLPALLDKAIAELDVEWEKVLGEAIKQVKKSFNHKLTREMEKRLQVEAENRLNTLLTRALNDGGSEATEL